MSKLIHEYLATEIRIQMWGGATRGEWTCGYGKTMRWSDRQDAGPLQWHMLECTMADERPTKNAWRAAIKLAVSAFTIDLSIVESATACWTDKTDGTIHMAFGDADTLWRPPSLRCLDDEGAWEFDHSGVSPSFDEDKWWPAETDSGSDVEADDAVGRSCIVTVSGTFAYNTD